MPVKKPIKKKYTHYHKNGSLWAKGYMVSEKMHGHWEWFRRDGTKMRSGNFKAGVQTGEWVTYNKKGEIVKVTKMK